jgi:putative hydrolase of the HAD superfamily
MIKNIVFDTGNVMVDFAPGCFLENKGFDREMTERILNASVRTPVWNELDRGVWTHSQLVDGFVRNDPGIEQELRRAFADFKEIVFPLDYAIPWIEELKGKGYRVYYLSNCSEIVKVQCPEAMKFLNYTDGGILSYADRVIKPDAAIYELFLSRFGLQPEETVFLDDTLANIEAAEKLGIHGIWFKSKEQAVEELGKLGVK